MATQKPPQVVGLEWAALGGAAGFPPQSNVPAVASNEVTLFPTLLNRINQNAGFAAEISWLG